eukprot:3102-Heterococcus_DN1.PRE.3
MQHICAKQKLTCSAASCCTIRYCAAVSNLSVMRRGAVIVNSAVSHCAEEGKAQQLIKRTDHIVRRTCTQPKLASMVTNHFHIYLRDRGVAACGARAAGAEVSGAAAQGDTIRR